MFLDLMKIKKKLPAALAAVYALAALSTVIYYVLYPSAAFFHADCSDTLLWAQASYESGKIFDPDFGYAAMLPFGGTTVMIPLIGIFGTSMAAQHLGIIIFTLILFAAVYFVCRSADFSRALSFFTVGTMALVLCSSAKLREIFYEHVIYYSICILIICVLIALYLRLEKVYKGTFSAKNTLALSIAVLIFTLLSALDGTQVIAMSVVPVAFALACEMLFSKEKLLSQKNMLPFYYCLVLVAGSVLGLCVLGVISEGISAGYANAYTSFSNSEEWINNLEKLPEAWCRLFGFDGYYGMSIFSPEAIVNIIRLGAAFIVALVPLACLFFINKFDKASRIIILSHFGVTAVIMFGYVFGILSLADWRLSPMICTGVLVCACAIKTVREYIVMRRVAVIGAAVLVLFSFISVGVVTGMEKNGIEQNKYYHIAEELDENGLNYGYATFWNSQCISVLSDFEVRAANVDVNDAGIAPCYYQSNSEWFEPVEGVDRYFVLISDYEIETLKETEDWHFFEEDVTETLRINGYTVYVFGSTEFLS